MTHLALEEEDAIREQMSRDLGNSRRDAVSAPLDARYSRAQEERALANEQADRRARMAIVGDDRDSQGIRAWNSKREK